MFRTAEVGDVLTDDVFLDGHPPLWRFQLQGRDVFAAWLKGYSPDGADTDRGPHQCPLSAGSSTELVGRHTRTVSIITDRKIVLCEVRERPHRRDDHLLQWRLGRRAPCPARRRDDR